MDVQGFGGDYDYGDDDYDTDDDKEIDELAEKEKKFFGEDYEGDFEGDNFLEESNENQINVLRARNSDDVVIRNFDTNPSSKIITRFNFNQDTEQNNYSFRNRIPKAVYGKNYFQTYDKLQAPAHPYKYIAHHKRKNKNQTYPDVIALVDDKYIHDVMSQNPPKSTRSSTFTRKRVPRLLSRYNTRH